MKQVILSFMFLISNTSISEIINYHKIIPAKETYMQMDYPYCVITFFQDLAGEKFLIKQIKFQNNFQFLARSVCEIVALDIGHSIGTPLNRASLIPAGMPYIGKDNHVPATIHSHVPGIRFDLYQGETYKGLNIRQNGPEKILGLTREIIYHMSRHKDLPILVALDTFVGNAGRGRSNYFYDETTDTFYGIDMASSFHQDLCGLSLHNIQLLLDNNQLEFSHEELKGIKRYTEILHQLITLHDPHTLCNMIEEHTKLAGFFNDSFFNKEVQTSCLEYLNQCKKTITDSYENARMLADFLNSYLAKPNIANYH